MRKGKFLKKILPLLIPVLVVSLLIGCAGTDEKATSITSVEMVPQRADMVAKINIGDILEDDDLESLYARLPKDPDDPQTFEEGVATVIKETGIDLRDLEEILLFGDTSSGTGDESYLGAIATGTFTEASFIVDIEETGNIEFSSYDHKGYEIYTVEDELVAIAFPNDDTLVIGTPELVEDVIDVKTGDEPALAGDVLEKYSRLGGALVKLATHVAPEYTEDALDQAYERLPVQIDLSAIANLETAGLTLDREEESVVLDLELCFTSTQSAKDVKGFISLAKMAISMPELLAEILGETSIPEDVLGLLPELLDKIKAETTDSCLSINITMPLDEIEQLYTEFEPAP